MFRLVSFFDFSTNSCVYFSFSTYVWHVQSISFSLIYSPEWIFELYMSWRQRPLKWIIGFHQPNRVEWVELRLATQRSEDKNYRTQAMCTKLFVLHFMVPCSAIICRHSEVEPTYNTNIFQLLPKISFSWENLTIQSWVVTQACSRQLAVRQRISWCNSHMQFFI